jgi:hypothetical protein
MLNKIIKTGNSCNIEVELFYFKDDEYYVVDCPALNTCGYGLTEKAAQESFDIQLNIFLEESHKRGTFEKCLLQYGWTLKQVPEFQYIPPKPTSIAKGSSHKRVSVPVYC